MLSTNTRVILLRHGQSTYNVLGLYQGSSDRSNLTELGRQQAILTGTFLKNIKFDAIYSSPLKRAQETAIEVLKKNRSNCCSPNRRYCSPTKRNRSPCLARFSLSIHQRTISRRL
ncbi:MAG: histidine phosphatase family protein [Nostocaceae cyanobacterium CSU_2_110]|nr:histidine phosphatase family protein [Nostocaceae cyanobacterium CSU_2_110]